MVYRQQRTDASLSMLPTGRCAPPVFRPGNTPPIVCNADLRLSRPSNREESVTSSSEWYGWSVVKASPERKKAWQRKNHSVLPAGFSPTCCTEIYGI